MRIKESERMIFTLDYGQVERLPHKVFLFIAVSQKRRDWAAQV